MTAARMHTSHSEQETIDLGAAFAISLTGGERIALLGDLGAGKTRFVRGMAIGLGHDPARVSSPTYVIAHEYATDAVPITLVHVDAYRMHHDDDIAQLGLDDIGGDVVLVAEWAERCEGVMGWVGGGVGEATHEIEIEHVGETTRHITIRELECPR